MQIKWQRLLTHTFIWLAAEIILSSLGIDTLADYGEFIFAHHSVKTIMHLHLH